MHKPSFDFINMDKNDFDQIIETSKLPIRGFKLIEYWGGTLFVIVFLSFICYSGFQNETNSTGFYLTLVCLLILILLLVWNNIKSRNFKRIQITHNTKDFKSAVLATARELKWEIHEFEPSIFIGRQKVDWQHDGFRITILRLDGIIYFNSIIEPSIASNPFSFGVNKRNLRIFKSKLRKAIKGEDVLEEVNLKTQKEEEAFMNESEWNF